MYERMLSSYQIRLVVVHEIGDTVLSECVYGCVHRFIRPIPDRFDLH